MASVRSYLSLIKFSHTIFAMPFAIIGFFLGWQARLDAREQFLRSYIPEHWLTYRENLLKPLLPTFILIILCMVFARSAAMAFNRYLDRKFDEKNPRTAVREIPSGIITPQNALAFTIISSIIFMGCCLLINSICFFLSPLALLIILGYSYTKRFTALCHLILGLGLSLAPIGAYLAVTGHFSVLPVLFSIAVLFWVSGFDVIYALQDEEFDKSQNLYSMPAALGKAKALRISELLHLISAAVIAYAGIEGNFGWLYWIGVAVFVGMLIYQHSVVSPENLSRVNIAFMTANGIASVVFAVFVILDIVIRNL